MIARQVPDDADWPQVISLTQMEDFLDNLGRRSVLGVLRDWLLAGQSRLTVLLQSCLPPIETGPANAEVPAGSSDMPGLFSMPQNAQLAPNVTICLAHRDHPLRPSGL